MNNKKGSKAKKIIGGIGSTIAVILLILGFTGAFDQPAHDITNGAYGDGNNAQHTLGNEETDGGRVIELKDFAEYTEDELIKVLNVEKNETGYYPNDADIKFMCIDGKVYSIMLKESSSDNKNYTLFGASIGENPSDFYNTSGDNFDFVITETLSEGKRDIYVEKHTGYSLFIDYIGLEITGVNYVLEAEEEVPSDGYNESDDLTYGTYAYDGDEYESCYAEIGFFSDGPYRDYINIEAWGYSGHEITSFNGVFIGKENGIYEAYDECFNTTISIIFTGDKMNIAVISTDVEDVYGIEGSYHLESPLNTDEVS